MKKRIISVLVVMMIVGSMVQTSVQADSGLSRPAVDNEKTIWQTIKFGKYYDDSEQSMNDISWRVLAVDGTKVFLIADKIIDCQPYDKKMDANWKESNIRSWLNQVFTSVAFNETEYNAIIESEISTDFIATKDKVFLLTEDETENILYGFSETNLRASETREAEATGYASEKGVVVSTEKYYQGNAAWWVRDSKNGATYINCRGQKGTTFACNDSCGVRPALWLDLSKTSNWWFGDHIEATHYDSGLYYKPIPKPGNIKINSIENMKGKKIKLRTDGYLDVKGYQIQYCTRKNFRSARNKYTKKTTSCIKGLRKTTYYVRARCYTNHPYTKARIYGNWSKCRKIKIVY